MYDTGVRVEPSYCGWGVERREEEEEEEKTVDEGRVGAAGGKSGGVERCGTRCGTGDGEK